MYGCLVVAATEIAHGFPNVWRGSERTLDAAVFFWFGFVACEALWIVIPGCLGFGAARRLLRVLTEHHATEVQAAAVAGAARLGASERPRLRLPVQTLRTMQSLGATHSGPTSVRVGAELG